MEKDFLSDALEANLARTREKEIEIPEEQVWFLELSANKWGIHNRTQEFITELNHKYINYQFVIDSLHNIILNDLWFYNSHQQSERALDVLIHIISDLLTADLKYSQRELLTTSLIKFIDRLTKLGDFPGRIIERCFTIINQDMRGHTLLYIRNSGYFKTYFSKVAQMPEYSRTIIDLTTYLLNECIDYWENTTKFEEWFQGKKQLFQPDNSEKMKNIGKPFFDYLRKELDNAKDWNQLCGLFYFNDISNYFRNFTEQLDTSLEKIYYLYYLLRLPGMAYLKDHLLYDMNRHLRSVLKELNEKEVIVFLDNLMLLFEDLKHDHAITVLDCMLTLGKEVIDTGNQSTISYFVKGLIGLGFQFPGDLSVDDNWQIKVNPNHVKNIRVWLELIEYSPYVMRDVLAALIVNLKLGGIFISDTDLFQRDVTKLLNSGITPVYREIKQLARIFPVYFKEIGAEGELREVTTAIDELSRRKDRLIHFLRKQAHTESNNTHIELTKKIIDYWYDGNTEPLKNSLPDDVFATLDKNKKWFSGAHEVLTELCKANDTNPRSLLSMEPEELEQRLSLIQSENDLDKKRILYIFQIYNLLMQKYSFESEDVLSMIKGYYPFSDVDLKHLQESLETRAFQDSIGQIYLLMNRLKEMILDPKQSEAWENIYYKRHVAIGIPSMYGQYNETKFEALGMMYRLEKTASQLMSEWVQTVNLEYITAKTFRHIYEVLELFKEGLELDGICNQGFNSNLDMLKYSLRSPSFSLDQYINIFQFMAQNIKQIIEEYFLDVFENSLKEIVPQVFSPDREKPESEIRQFIQMESEKFFRDNLSSAFLVQDLDNFIMNIIDSLTSMIDNYSNDLIRNMMTYDSDLTISPLYRETVEMDNPVFLGAKAFFLKKMISYDFNVPTGFVLTTEVFRHINSIMKHPSINHEMDQLILKNIAEVEKRTNKKFGDPENPLFFSVRSGTSISMPGAMKTFLNVGMNDEIAELFGKNEGCAWTSWDCYRRFLQSWGMAYGIPRDEFDQVMDDQKKRYQVLLKKYFSPEQMKELAYAYKNVLNRHQIYIEKDPFKQLKQAILNVVDSWGSDSAVYYKNHMQIADEWGTAVIVQSMVLGNLSECSGTGVIFTSSLLNEYTGINLYGDFALCSQGEDVVSGLVNTLPITEKQRQELYSDCSISLESAFPEIYHALLEYSKQLIDQYGFTNQEIEFTFESERPEDLYILQTRNQNLKKKKSDSTFRTSPQEMKLLAQGIGIGGGVMSGILAFGMDDLQKYKEQYPDDKLILIRPDTVPDDIPLIFLCDGLITAKGGTTSHAAVTAASLDKVCIVNCKGFSVDDEEKRCTVNGVILQSGDRISIDGNLGNVYLGAYD